MDIVTIRTYADQITAQLAKTYLEEEGIPCFLADQMAASMPTVFGTNIGVRLQVMEKDAPEAVELLQQLDRELAETIDETQTTDQDDENRSDAPSTLTAVRNDTCPNCNSPLVDKEILTTFPRLLAAIVLLGLPLLFLKPKRTCKKCGHTW